MPLNESKGNMYPFVTHTWNTVKGKCPHDCAYCYMKRFGKQPELHFDKRELKTDLGTGNFIFVGSSCDMFSSESEYSWVVKTLEHCKQFPTNNYLFQTKNPLLLAFYLDHYNYKNIVAGTTIETNRKYRQMGKTPSPLNRAYHMGQIAKKSTTMVTIEPIMDFDLDVLVYLVEYCNPQWVNIGADSQGHNLPEPAGEKIDALVKELKNFTEVKIKKNLNRLYRRNT